MRRRFARPLLARRYIRFCENVLVLWVVASVAAMPVFIETNAVHAGIRTVWLNPQQSPDTTACQAHHITGIRAYIARRCFLGTVVEVAGLIRLVHHSILRPVFMPEFGVIIGQKRIGVKPRLLSGGANRIQISA